MSNTRKHKNLAKYKRDHGRFSEAWEKKNELKDKYGLTDQQAWAMYEEEHPPPAYHEYDKFFARPRAVREIARQKNRSRRRAARVRTQQGDDESILPEKRNALWLAY